MYLSLSVRYGKKQKMKSLATSAVFAFNLATTAHAPPINGTRLFTPGIIFGSGNANGSFTD
jgi:hypothetical protein